MCTRILYVDGQKNPKIYDPNRPSPNVVTGRNMDWSTSLKSEIWAFPANMERQGEHTIIMVIVPLRGHRSTAA